MKYVFITVFIVTFILFNVNDSYCKKDRKVVRELVVTAYAYTHSGNPSAVGIYPLYKGVVAVDPKVIPLYTKMHVEGYGYAEALDTGDENIKGKTVDLFFDSYEEAIQWGVRKVKVKIYE